MKRLLFITGLISILSSCTSVFLGMYGIKSPKQVDEKVIFKYAKKYKVPLNDCYLLDTTYVSFLQSFDKNKFSAQIKNHYQPLQVLYYNKFGQLESFHVNCNTGGFPNLKWNRNGIFKSFPPKQQTLTDSILPLKTHLMFTKLLSKSDSLNAYEYDYIILVHWNRFMGRQSKRLIRFVKNNIKQTDKKTKVIYLNSDNIFAMAN